jgi:hypothetical protein
LWLGVRLSLYRIRSCLECSPVVNEQKPVITNYLGGLLAIMTPPWIRVHSSEAGSNALYSVASILIVVAATFVKVFPFSGHLLGVGVALGITLLRQPDRIGGWFARLPFRPVVASAVVCACVLLATDFVLLKLLPAAGLPAVDFSRFHALHGDAKATAQWIAGIWVLVSPSEELIGRAFLIDQWSAVLEDLKGTPVLAVAGSALTFGAVHFYEGPTGVITNTIAGLWLGGLYLRQRRTLWACIAVHGVVDSVAMVAFFYGGL